MYKASAGVLLPTSIIGSLPRPAWHTAQIGSKSFLEAMVNARWREQYEDAVSTHLRAQEVAGLDICTDGDAHYDEEIGGWSWQSYPLTHMAGFSREVALTPPAVANAAPPRGHILHDQLEARVLPRDHRADRPGNLQYGAMWKVAQRLTPRPVKFGTIMPELLAAAVQDDYYKDPVERVWALQRGDQPGARTTLADAGCPVIQMEEPQIHMVPARGKPFGQLDIPDCQDLQQHGQRPARQDRVVVPHLLGQPGAAAHLPRHPELPADARGAQRGRRRRADLRDLLAPAPATSKAIGKTSPTRKSSSASSTTTRCRSSGPTRSPTSSARRSSTFRPSGWSSRPIAAWAAKA